MEKNYIIDERLLTSIHYKRMQKKLGREVGQILVNLR